MIQRMTRVCKATLPERSILHARVGDYDFLDCYSVESNRSVREAAEIALNFPDWARVLVKLRNLIVVPLGLSSEGPEGTNRVGMFPIESETESELVAGFNDKHLDFRISVFSESRKLFLATWVHPHNIGGRLYLAAIMPFHILIARNALQRVMDT